MTLTPWSVLYLGVKSWFDWQGERARALANQAELVMLCYLLNPDFLFNALNSIRLNLVDFNNLMKTLTVLRAVSVFISKMLTKPSYLEMLE